MSDEEHFSYVYKLVERWFVSRGEARRWYKQKTIPSLGTTPEQFVEDQGVEALEQWIESKEMGSFE